jgi:putative membrane protein
MPYLMHGGMWGGRGLAFCGGLLLVGLLVVLVVWLILAAQRRGRLGPGPGMMMHHPMAGGSAQAIEIARERYARGDITREQFLQIKADLEGSPMPPQPPQQ